MITRNFVLRGRRGLKAVTTMSTLVRVFRISLITLEPMSRREMFLMSTKSSILRRTSEISESSKTKYTSE